ncbi:F-box/kelch-repeat protein At3g06240-like [Quercus lobata]|nr:F-box/kelch-repeat protein At3g06240-like [Quercus lobata]
MSCVKSVMRFRCVCKSWDSSITTPYFISTHLNNNNNNNSYNKNHDNGYVIHMSNHYNRAVCTVALGRTFDRISEVQYPFDFTPGCAHVVGSCNGLLCLADFGEVIYLWNPSIKKFKKLPGTCLGKLDKFTDLTIGFAYHSENNDHKVVRISFSIFLPTEVEVYTLSLDSWRRVRYNLTTNVKFINNCCFLPIPLVSGALHWMVRIIEGEEENRIIALAFDVNSEKFKRLALPHGFIEADTLHRYLASFKEKLAFITCEPIEQPGFPCQCTIWVMKKYGIVESWNKLFVIPFERKVQCLAFTEYGSLLVGHIYDPVERQRQQEAFKFVLVDIETPHEKKDPDIQCPSSVATFMESLILLDGPNVASY